MNTVAATWISVCIVDYYVAIANYYSLTAPAVWLQAPKTPFGYMGELGEERLHCGTGFGDRYRVPKVTVPGSKVTSVAAFCVSKVNLFSILLCKNSISV